MLFSQVTWSSCWHRAFIPHLVPRLVPTTQLAFFGGTATLHLPHARNNKRQCSFTLCSRKTLMILTLPHHLAIVNEARAGLASTADATAKHAFREALAALAPQTTLQVFRLPSTACGSPPSTSASTGTSTARLWHSPASSRHPKRYWAHSRPQNVPKLALAANSRPSAV
jgi:hypothetical protein